MMLLYRKLRRWLMRGRRYPILLSVFVLGLLVYLWGPRRVVVHVLEAGLPIKRFADTSGTYDPAVKGGGSRALKLGNTLPWALTQSWEPRTRSAGHPGNVRFPSCGALIRGDRRALGEAQAFMGDHFPVTRSDMDYIRETRDCKQFLKARGYILDAPQEERDFPLAFSMLFFKDLELAERLLRAVYRPHNFYCLHLDNKSPPATHRAAEHLVSCFDNVFLASTPVTVKWGTFSVLEPELICMKDLWAYKTWRYFINLTGQEFPLKTTHQLVQILTALNGANDSRWVCRRLYQNRWYNNFAAPHEIQPRKGSLHMTASRGLVDFILHNPVARDFLHWVNHTKFPDETFFSTLNHNPHLHVPGAYLGPPDTDAALKPYLSRFKNWGPYWKDGQGRTNFNWPCHGKRVRNICVFGLGDLPLLTSRKEMFANKFHREFEPVALDCLEEWLWNMTMDEYSGRIMFDTTFYRTLDVATNHV
ncbi:beta-1,3-galactosyl-O-glycosyl-glycoprotein beta-1,6-N-acetylglucosaminyltransferase-like [Babylonia areolata]|uniref:beta-1,3-galactosyl-O-glycosyl-glycoprotein beta-1,6-N-acetylglucosaminyltransferase-like n=1 Tax=Babylonia areolata TaxID=304850 RepID=UPI003FCF6F23